MRDIFKKPNHVYSTKNNMLVQPKCLRFNNGIHSFRYEGAKLLNLLDPRFNEVNSVTEFKVAIRTWHGGDCDVTHFFLCLLQIS